MTSVTELQQYPCCLGVAGDSVFVGLSALTGEQWNGSLLVKDASGSHSLALNHGVSSLAVIGGGELLLIGSDSSKLETVKVHKSAMKLGEALSGHHAPIAAVSALSGDRVVSSSQDMSSILWDAKTLSVIHVYDAHEGPITLNAADNSSFVSYSPFDRQLKIFKAGEARAVHSIATPTEATALSLRGDTLTVGLYSGGTLAYDLRNLTAQPLARPSLHSAAVRAFAFHGERVVSASDDGTVRFSDNDSKIQHADFVRGLAVVGIQLVSASWDKTLRFTPL